MEVGKYCGSPNYTLDHRINRERGPQDTLQTSSAYIPLRILDLLPLLVATCLARPFTPQSISKVLWSTHANANLEFKTLCGKRHFLLKQQMYLENKHEEQSLPIHTGMEDRFLSACRRRNNGCRSCDFSTASSYLVNRIHLMTFSTKRKKKWSVEVELKEKSSVPPNSYSLSQIVKYTMSRDNTSTDTKSAMSQVNQGNGQWHVCLSQLFKNLHSIDFGENGTSENLSHLAFLLCPQNFYVNPFSLYFKYVKFEIMTQEDSYMI